MAIAPKVEFWKKDGSEIITELIFGTVDAGTNSNQPDALMYPLHLWNDKEGTEGSVTMISVKVGVIRKYIKDEPLGTSDGTPDQTFTVSVPPIHSGSPLNVYVGDTYGGFVLWERVEDLDLVGAGNYYECDFATGKITFGNYDEYAGGHGNIPPNGKEIKIDYTPDKAAYGKEWAPDKWMKVKSLGVIGAGIDDDLEGEFYYIGGETEHSIGNIPSNCARKLFFEIDAPQEAEPTGGSMAVKVKISYQYE